MPNICLQIGRCGNHLGAKFMENIFQDFPSDSNHWFNPRSDGKVLANAVIVNSTFPLQPESSELGWSYQSDLAVLGRSNHWAEGFNVLGPALYDSIYENIRQLAERLDNVCGFMSIASLCGGTGSGLSSYVTRLLRDNFPQKIVSNVAVIPKLQERTTIRDYNAIFAASKMYDNVDSVLLCSNDDPCMNNPLKGPFNHDVANDVFAERLSCVLQCDLNQNMLSRLPLLALHHDFRFLNVLSSPIFYSKSSTKSIPWKSVLNNIEILIQSPEKKAQKGLLPSENHRNLNKCVSLLIALRNNCKDDIVPNISERFCAQAMYPPWASKIDRLQIFKRNGSLNGRDKFWAVAVNNMYHLPFFENLVDKSWKSFNNRSYVHHFSCEGVAGVDFVETFLTLEQIVRSYKQIGFM